ncbi:MAG TPA: LysE family translocator [Pseudonocardiaceae bacterium]
MVDASTIMLFVLATAALLVVPGPAVLYIVTRSVAQGRDAGLVSVLGVHAGSVVHVLAAAAGVSAVLAASQTAFAVVRWLGVAYLVFLGVRVLHRTARAARAARAARVAGGTPAGGATSTGGPGHADDHPAARPALPLVSRRRLFAEGALVNVLNPKTGIFFLAFTPQFVDPAGPVAPQMLLFGCGFIVLGVLSDGGYALAAGALSGRLRRTERARLALDGTSGVVYLGMAVLAAVMPGSATAAAK